ncbi:MULTISPECIES: hypothetical protein [unclassified Ensifer]|uniref:hypothetical protein n=1 Tax=unclassified Ensifer TaxID=2633371 RepID=UPI001FCE12E3|nr:MULTISPECIES: hypothetical protein [unclassified Ensifer]
MVPLVDAAPDVARQAALFGQELYLCGIHLPVQKAGAPAGRAVAVDETTKLFVDFDGDIAAMARKPIGSLHGSGPNPLIETTTIH